MCTHSQICTQSTTIKRATYIGMNINAFLAESALREVRTVLFGVEVRALRVREVAIRPVSALDFLFIFLRLLLVLFSKSYIVFMCVQIDDSVAARLQLHLVQGHLRGIMRLLDSLLQIPLLRFVLLDERGEILVEVLSLAGRPLLLHPVEHVLAFLLLLLLLISI